MDLNIDARKLAAIILAPKFGYALFRAGRRTARSFNETGFFIFFNPSTGRVTYSKIQEGNYFSIHGDRMDDSATPDVDQILVGWVHFHPEATGPAVPSGGNEGDLQLPGLYYRQHVAIKGDIWQGAVRGLFGIAKARADGSVELLIFQTDGKPTPRHTHLANDAVDNYFEQRNIKPVEEEIVYSGVTTQEIATLMRKYGFNTAVLNLPSPSDKDRS